MRVTQVLKQCLQQSSAVGITFALALQEAMDFSPTSKLQLLQDNGSFYIVIMNGKCQDTHDDIFDYGILHEKAKRLMYRIFPSETDQIKLSSKFETSYIISLVAAIGGATK